MLYLWCEKDDHRVASGICEARSCPCGNYEQIRREAIMGTVEALKFAEQFYPQDTREGREKTRLFYQVSELQERVRNLERKLSYFESDEAIQSAIMLERLYEEECDNMVSDEYAERCSSLYMKILVNADQRKIAQAKEAVNRMDEGEPAECSECHGCGEYQTATKWHTCPSCKGGGHVRP